MTTSREPSDGPEEAKFKMSLESLAREVANVDSEDEDGAPSASAKEDLATRILLSERYSGAFAHPSLLKQFDQVVQNGAERAFALTEREQQHRHEMESKLVNAEIDAIKAQGFDRRLAIILVFLLVLAGLVIAAVLAAIGKPVGAGVSIGFSALAVLGTIFAATRVGKGRDGNDNSA
jgi:uncharacterized membrane protein